jgi:uncharacterized protein (DUF1015 family)
VPKANKKTKVSEGDFRVSVIKPFRALRPRRELARQVSCVPYDICSREELNALIENNPVSFLRVTRAESEVSSDIHSENQAVFELAKQNLRQLIDEKVLNLDDEHALYIYRLSSEAHTQTGVVACCSLAEYENDLIKKHEKVRPDKVQDRTRHMITVRAQTGLIFLAYRGTEKINHLVSEAVTTAPLYDFVCSLNVHHQIWRVSETEDLIAAFAEIPALYIADGHHRIAAASLVRKMLTAMNPNINTSMFEKPFSDAVFNEEYNYVIAGMFPEQDLKILPYNRVVKDLNNLSEEEFLRCVGEKFVVLETENPAPEKRGEICMYLSGKWRKLRLADHVELPSDLIHRLDVSILQDYILSPILGIEDIQTDTRIDFIGGIRGTRELEKLVDEGKARVAFSMFPTAIEDLFAVSDAGEIMPPKSTWFEPKLRDGLLIHLI